MIEQVGDVLDAALLVGALERLLNDCNRVTIEYHEGRVRATAWVGRTEVLGMGATGAAAVGDLARWVGVVRASEFRP